MTQSNQRVTNALLGEKLDRMQKDVSEIKQGVALNTEARITSKERWRTHEAEHSNLQKKSIIGDISAAVAGVVAAAVAAASK